MVNECVFQFASHETRLVMAPLQQSTWFSHQRTPPGCESSFENSSEFLLISGKVKDVYSALMYDLIQLIRTLKLTGNNNIHNRSILVLSTPFRHNKV